MSKLKDKIKIIIFGTQTSAGKIFDIVLIITIFISLLIVLLDSVKEYHLNFGDLFYFAEWIFTILFTIEYILRIYCIRRVGSYIFSFYGIIDFLALIPTYISLFYPGTQVLAVIRVLRVLRIFRILKLVQFMEEADKLKSALLASRKKITVFLFSILNIVIILGAIMYLIEGESSGFTSIPRSIYWAIVTLTTVGYGDISPATNLGQGVASIIMIIGYSIIAIPTGIVTSEINYLIKRKKKIDCIVCEDKNQEEQAKFCNACGAKMINNH